MTPYIEVIEEQAVVTEVILPQAKSEGYMAWYCISNPGFSGVWTQAYPGVEPIGERDQYRCPYPLFVTREKAIEACGKMLPNGGTCKIVKITL